MLSVALGGADKIEGFGRGSLVDAAGELQHGAQWHAPGGYAKSLWEPGQSFPRLDVPITHINACCVRSHFDSMEIGLNNAPRTDELLFAPVMTTGARIHARSGGLDADAIKGEDGLK